MVLYEYVTFSSWLLLYFEVRPTFLMREVTIILREILQTSLPEKPEDIFQSNCILKSLRATSGKENVTEEETQVMSISSTQVSSWLLTHKCMVQTQSSCDDSKITELRVEM